MRLPDGTVRKRRKSYDEPGHARELTFSCFRGLPLLSKDRTRLWFIAALDAARREHDFELWAYVIMPEHVHVLLYPRSSEHRMASISECIKQSVARRAIRYLKAGAPDWLSHLRTMEGGCEVHRFWQPGGGYDRNIRRPSTAWSSVHYIHNNPVRRGLVADPTEWRWSSARWYAGDDDVLLRMDDCPPDP